MYVIVAEFTVKPERVGDFLDAIKVNAGHSVAREPGCRQFDVCVDAERGEVIYLYEVYDDEAAFQAHIKTDHFHVFDGAVGDWVVDKSVTAYHRVFPTN
jgi:quinol monooxygenase YgiN